MTAPVWVNPDHIVRVFPMKVVLRQDSGATAFLNWTPIEFDYGDAAMDVNEKVDHVIRLIEGGA